MLNGTWKTPALTILLNTIPLPLPPMLKMYQLTHRPCAHRQKDDPTKAMAMVLACASREGCKDAMATVTAGIPEQCMPCTATFQVRDSPVSQPGRHSQRDRRHPGAVHALHRNLPGAQILKDSACT